MKKRILETGLEISAIGLGCMGFTQSYPPYPDKNDVIRTLREAVELGVPIGIAKRNYSYAYSLRLVVGSKRLDSSYSWHKTSRTH